MKGKQIRILAVFAFLLSVVPFGQGALAKTDAEYHALLVKHMRFIELSLFAFEKSFTEGCIKKSSREICAKYTPELNPVKLNEMYLSGLKKEMSNGDLEPIIRFMETRNGQIFSEITYQQNIGNTRYLDGIPDITAEKVEAINQFRQTPEFKKFEVKLNQFYHKNMIGIQNYILKESAVSLKNMVLE